MSSKYLLDRYMRQPTQTERKNLSTSLVRPRMIEPAETTRLRLKLYRSNKYTSQYGGDSPSPELNSNSDSTMDDDDEKLVIDERKRPHSGEEESTVEPETKKNRRHKDSSPTPKVKKNKEKGENGEKKKAKAALKNAPTPVPPPAPTPEVPPAPAAVPVAPITTQLDMNMCMKLWSVHSAADDAGKELIVRTLEKLIEQVGNGTHTSLSIDFNLPLKKEETVVEEKMEDTEKTPTIVLVPESAPTVVPTFKENKKYPGAEMMIADAPVLISQPAAEIINIIDTKPENGRKEKRANTSTPGTSSPAKSIPRDARSAEAAIGISSSTMAMLTPRQSPHTLNSSFSLDPPSSMHSHLTLPTTSAIGMALPSPGNAVMSHYFTTANGQLMQAVAAPGGMQLTLPGTSSSKPITISESVSPPTNAKAKKEQKVPALQNVPPIIGTNGSQLTPMEMMKRQQMMMQQQRLPQTGMINTTPQVKASPVSAHQLQSMQIYNQQVKQQQQQQQLRTQQLEQQQRQIENQKILIISRIQAMYKGKATEEQINEHIKGPSLRVEENGQIITIPNPFYAQQKIASPTVAPRMTNTMPTQQQMMTQNRLMTTQPTMSITGQLPSASLQSQMSLLNNQNLLSSPLLQQQQQQQNLAAVSPGAAQMMLAQQQLPYPYTMNNMQLFQTQALTQQQMQQLLATSTQQQVTNRLPVTKQDGNLPETKKKSHNVPSSLTSTVTEPSSQPSTVPQRTLPQTPPPQRTFPGYPVIDESKRKCNEWSIITVPLPTKLHVDCNCFDEHPRATCNSA